jgi:TolA-binding protein
MEPRDAGGPLSMDQRPAPMPVGTASTWVTVACGVFGALTLLAFFAFALISGKDPKFICNAFTMLAAVFALGTALSAGFIGGAAAVSGNLGSMARENALIFSAGGGIAVLFISFWAFQSFKGDECSLHKVVEGHKQRINTLETEHGDLQKKMQEKMHGFEDLKVTHHQAMMVVKEKHEQQLAELRAELDKKFIALRDQDIVIVAFSSQPELSRIIVEYTDDEGNPKRAVRQRNVFRVPRKNMLAEDPGIFINYDTTALPPERQNNPPPISIERIYHTLEPLKIQLFLNFPTLTNLK